MKCLNTVLEEQITDVSSEGMGKYFLTITEQNEIVHLWVKYSMEVEGSPVANENHKIVIFGKFHEGDGSQRHEVLCSRFTILHRYFFLQSGN